MLLVILYHIGEVDIICYMIDSSEMNQSYFEAGSCCGTNLGAS